MESKILQGENTTMKQILKLNHKDSWAEQNRVINKELNIKDTDIYNTKYHLKHILQKKTKNI